MKSIISKFKFCAVLLLWLCATEGYGQEQFQKRFDISFDHDSFFDALNKLAATQAKTHLMGGKAIFKDCPPVTMQLHQVTLDQAIDAVLATQTLFKDYVITHTGNHNTLQLRKEKGGARYFNMDKRLSRFYHVGDRLPDTNYTVYGEADRTLKLSGFGGKLVILDLWGVHCASCIVAMPRLEKLQEQYAGKVEILLVTKSSREEVRLLKEKSAIVKNTKLPILCGENNLASLFDYASVPTQVWIDGQGTIRYITGKEIANEKVISKFLAGTFLAISETKDTTVVSRKPMMISLDFIHQGKFDLSLFLAKHDESKFSYTYRSDFPLDSDSTKWFAEEGVSIDDLYKAAYGIEDNGQFSDTRIVKEFSRRHDYEPDEITGQNLYDFELILKDRAIATRSFFKIMQAALDVKFQLVSSFQRCSVPCYVFRKIDNSRKLITKGKSADFEIKDNRLFVTNETLNTVLNLAIQPSCRQSGTVINETGLDPELKIDCLINIDLEGNLPEVNRTLRPYGLSVTKEMRALDCIVLKDIN